MKEAKRDETNNLSLSLSLFRYNWSVKRRKRGGRTGKVGVSRDKSVSDISSRIYGDRARVEEGRGGGEKEIAEARLGSPEGARYPDSAAYRYVSKI